MAKKTKSIIIMTIVLGLLTITGVTYAKYVFSRQFAVELTSESFYFEATANATQVVFPRTANKSDFDVILTTETNLNLVIKNNDGTNFNNFDTTYTVSVVDSPKFSFKEGDTVTKTIKGGSLLNENITLNLTIQDLTNTSKTVKIRVTPIAPYQGSPIDFTFNVVQEGAIQTIEDLVDLSLAVRDRSLKGVSSSDVISERFKLTRSLDFEDNASYENPNRTDYYDVNGNGTIGATLKIEVTSDTGFLPIGMEEYKFRGGFNGGGYTISNLQIHKSLQKNIGFFCNTLNATIKDLKFASSHVTNENQTAGLVIGKVEGGLIEGITTDSNSSVASNDTENTKEDTYTGGIAGFVSENATIRNCENAASVKTTFKGDATTYSGPAGGITAWAGLSNIENCTNRGEVIGQSYVGGITGFAGMQNEANTTSGGTVSGCYNYGAVSSYVTSSASGGKHIGGIAGYNKAGATITNCENHAPSVKGLSSVGGIVGNNPGKVTYCKNYTPLSKISGTGSNRGIVGSGSGTLTGNSHLGGN